MTPGAHLSHAARLAGDAHRSLLIIQRTLLAAHLHLENAGAQLLPATEVEFAEIIADAGALADELQRVADDYGRRAADRALTERAAA